MRTPASLLGGPVIRVPFVEFERLLLDVDAGVQDVHVPTAETEELPEPQPSERGQDDHQPLVALDLVGESEDLLDGRDRPLGCPLDAGTLDEARVLHEHGVLDRRVEDRAQQPVGLGRRRRAGMGAGTQLCVP